MVRRDFLRDGVPDLDVDRVLLVIAIALRQRNGLMLPPADVIDAQSRAMLKSQAAKGARVVTLEARNMRTKVSCVTS
jgi:hypothetical protein